jgi:hypothetical protein
LLLVETSDLHHHVGYSPMSPWIAFNSGSLVAPTQSRQQCAVTMALPRRFLPRYRQGLKPACLHLILSCSVESPAADDRRTVLKYVRRDTADAYEPQPKFNGAAGILEAWLRDSFKAGLVTLSAHVSHESFINAQ